MNATLASTNVTFSFLKGSSDFLNLVLDNITCAVMLLNNRMELVAFNDALKALFPSAEGKNLQYIKCGEALGCSFQVEEMKDCGTTAHCLTCQLRVDAIKSYLEDIPTIRKEVTRSFYGGDGKKVEKTILYSTRMFNYLGEKYLVMFIESRDC